MLATVFEAVVIVTDRTSLLEATARLDPQLAVIDLGLARRDVEEFMRELRLRCRDLAVIFLSVHDEPAVARAVIGSGANGFVVKGHIATELMPAVDEALRSRRFRA